jgi:hypothetical protein
MIVYVLDYIIKILIGILLADFIMGVYHWLKDTYYSPFTPIIGKTFIWSSRLHHIRPRYVTEFTDKALFISSAKWTLIWMAPLCYLTGITPLMVSLFLTIALNDVIHKYAHLSDPERPYWATFLQQIYIFQSYDEHHLHHISPHEVNYCPITPYLNIILEKTNFWKRSESFIEHYFGMKAREHEDLFVEDNDYPAGIKFIQKVS